MPSLAEFREYVKTELAPIAAHHGYKISLEPGDAPALDPNKWPGWRYDPVTKEGAIFQHPDEVPEGWTDSPWASAE